jgi:hypothetical protein
VVARAFGSAVVPEPATVATLSVALALCFILRKGLPSANVCSLASHLRNHIDIDPEVNAKWGMPVVYSDNGKKTAR